MGTEWGESFHKLKQGKIILWAGPVSTPDVVRDAIELVRNPQFVPFGCQAEMSSFIQSNHGAAVFSEMATGKTCSVLMGCGLDNGKEIDFIDASSGCIKNGARTRIIEDGLKNNRQNHKIIFINHEGVWRDPLAKFLETLDLFAICIDESHRIKSSSSKVCRWAAMQDRRHPRARRIILTGTPCPRDPRDLFGQYLFINKQLFGTNKKRFESRIAFFHPVFPSKIEAWRDDGIAWLNQQISTNSIQIRAEDAVDLPEAIHRRIRVPLRPATQRIYDQLEKDFVASVFGSSTTADNPLTRSIRLRQLTGGYVTTDEPGSVPQLVNEKKNPEKIEVLADFLQDVPVDEPVVVFCEFTAELQAIKALATSQGRKVFEISGRQKQVAEWNKEGGVIAVQTRAGGTGINLSKARITVFYSTGWSLADYEQAKARTRRTTQKASSCLYVHLVVRDSLDEVVYGALRSKQNVVDKVCEGLRKRRAG